jgi:hypothetical protein
MVVVGVPGVGAGVSGTGVGPVLIPCDSTQRITAIVAAATSMVAISPRSTPVSRYDPIYALLRRIENVQRILGAIQGIKID